MRLRWAGQAVIIAMLAIPHMAHAQSGPDEAQPSWVFTGTLGGYALGNKVAVTNWLRRNGYGFTDPPHCGFTVLLESRCDPPVKYPQVSASGVVGWTFSV